MFVHAPHKLVRERERVPSTFFNNIMLITLWKQFARKLQNRQKKGRLSPDVRRTII